MVDTLTLIRSLKRQLLEAKLQAEELKAELVQLQRARAIHRNGGVPYEVSPEVVAKAVAEYRAGGTSIRKLCAKHNLQRGRLHRAIQEHDRINPTFERPGKHVYRTTKEICQGHANFIARLAAEE